MHYIVCTPKYTYYYPSYAMESPEIVVDCVEVDAPNKKRAKVEAVRKLRADGSDWMLDQQSDGASPFTGLQVFDAVCKHGFCHCTFKECNLKFFNDDYCDLCYIEDVVFACEHKMVQGETSWYSEDHIAIIEDIRCEECGYGPLQIEHDTKKYEELKKKWPIAFTAPTR